MDPTTTISVVIPVYKSEAIIPELVRRITNTLNAENVPYEIILVNDGSTDGSWNAMEKAAAEFSQVRAIDLMRNFGQHNALLCGIRAARYDVIVTMDDDLQHPVSEIRALLAELAAGHEVVYGTSNEPQHDVWRNLASRLTKLALRSAMGAESAA